MSIGKHSLGSLLEIWDAFHMTEGLAIQEGDVAAKIMKWYAYFWLWKAEKVATPGFQAIEERLADDMKAIIPRSLSNHFQ